MDNKTFAFIILHYQSINHTLECVKSILELDNYSNVRIVVVDNASPNQTGKELELRFINDDRVDVLLSEENAGFSKANNWGCNFAYQKWNPDYYIVANNDIIFGQKDILSRIDQEYTNTEFGVLGPDIFDVTHNIHQSPMGKNLPTEKEAFRTMFLNGLCYYTYGITYPLVSKYCSKIENMLKDADGYTERQEDVWLMGACLIFSAGYIRTRSTEDRTEAFWPETQFYYEEAIIGLWCKRNHVKCIYSPELRVNHINGGATRSNKDNRSRIRFQVENYMKSSNTYLKLLKR